MSNEEKKMRDEYQTGRKRKIMFGIVLLSIVSFFTLLFYSVYVSREKTYYVNYNETSEVDYRVYLKENDFYDDEYLDKNQAYISSLINNIVVDFSYQISMDTKDVYYECSYYIDAKLDIVDKNSNSDIFNPVYMLKEKESFTQNSSSNFSINERVVIDYNRYNELSNRFINVYSLDNVKSSLIVTVHININSICSSFESDNCNEYDVSLIIPLTTKTVSMEISSSVPSNNSLIACKKGINNDFFKVVSITLLCFDIIIAVLFGVYVYLTRNNHINYSIRVKKIVSAYKSYIQKINNMVKLDDYQELYIDTFDEMLEIRDTIQKPIIMFENDDKTCTTFCILSNDIAYLYIIKVDGYDDIYSVIE